MREFRQSIRALRDMKIVFRFTMLLVLMCRADIVDNSSGNGELNDLFDTRDIKWDIQVIEYPIL